MRLKPIAAAVLLAAVLAAPAIANDPAKPAEPAAVESKPAAPAAADAKPAEAATEAKPAEAASGGAGGPVPLLETVKAAKGTLKNPFTDNAQAIEEGKKLYLSYSCNGCHGGGGGGGMCPPLTNETFIYGSEDDTLFRLIALGSVDLIATGFARVKLESVKGPMPGYSEIIDDSDKLWKIIAFIRSVYKGRPHMRNW